jgi:YidC/Oxa1 family membrane protein insertase
LAEYRNPQQEPGNERNMLLVFVVVFAVVILGQFFLFKNKPVPPTNTTPDVSQSAPATPDATTTSGKTAPSVSSTPAVARAAGTKTATAEVETTVENDLYKIVFTNRGAQVKSWILKKYNDENGHPLDLVNKEDQKDPEKFGLPLSFYTYDQNLRKQLNSVLYVSDAPAHITAPGELSFVFVDGGVTVHKIFTFADSYVIGVETSVTQNGKAVQAFPLWPTGFGDQLSGPSYAASRLDYMTTDGKVERLAAKKVSGGNTVRGPFYWAGPQDQYFAAIFLPENPSTAAMVTLHESVTIPKDPSKPDPTNVVKYDVLGAAVGDLSGLTR